MQGTAYAERIERVKRQAHGRWDEILAVCGVAETILRGRNGPCPLCGGTDRFQYTDKYGEGNYHCRHCGAGGGLKLLQAVRGVEFHAVLEEVERCVGALPLAPARTRRAAPAERMGRLAQRLWDEARPVAPGDEVDRYLQSRRLVPSGPTGPANPASPDSAACPAALRLHPALGFYERDAAGRNRLVANHPAMLAAITSPDGRLVSLHRTYLPGGAKLAGGDVRKVLCAGIQGAAVRLDAATEELAVCEGIETGLAVRLATGKPVWAALSAGNLEKIVLPETVRRVCIYADNDAGREFTGQCAAYLLARRLKREQPDEALRQVSVFVPRQAGADWADVWLHRLAVAAATAADAVRPAIRRRTTAPATPPRPSGRAAASGQADLLTGAAGQATEASPETRPATAGQLLAMPATAPTLSREAV